jgi:hypothetical protein
MSNAKGSAIMIIKSTLLASTVLLLAGTSVLSTTTAQSGGQAYSGDTVSIENFIGTVEIRTGGGSQINVAISNPGEHAGDPTVSQNGNLVAIDGGESVRNLNCSNRNGSMRIGRGGWNGWRSGNPISEYPTLTITAPESVALELRRSAFQGETGDLGRADITMSSCGNLVMGDIAGAANINISGSGDITAGSVGDDLGISINGSGDVELGRIGGEVDLDIAGSGDVIMADVSGDTEVNINGSGDVRFADIGGVTVRVSGSGDIAADSMNGAFFARINGSGDIEIDGGRAEPFEAQIHGSGDIDFDGTAVNVEINEGGSGDIDIADIEGSVNWRRHGRTVLRVGDSQ